MAVTVTADLDGPAHRMSVSRMMLAAVRRCGSRRVGPAPSQHSWRSGQVLIPCGCLPPVSPPGVIGAAIVRAARRSARLSRIGLARRLNVSTATVRGWESGIVPLFCVPYGQLQQLAQALDGAGAQAGTELVICCSRPGATCC